MNKRAKSKRDKRAKSRQNLLRQQLITLSLVIVWAVAPLVMSHPGKLRDSSQNLLQPARLASALPRIAALEEKQVWANTAAESAGVDCHKVMCLALTFDDGPNPQTTPLILDVLEKAHVPATFFLIGSLIPSNEELLQRMQAGGNEIGNHSWSHPDMTKLSPEEIKQQIELTQQVIMSADVPEPTLFRPPYGAVNQAIQDNVPLSILLWNEDPQDWAAHTPQEVIAAVEGSAKAGGIIDLHDIYKVTAEALPQIISDLTAKNFHFVTVSHLLELTPNSRGLYYGHP